MKRHGLALGLILVSMIGLLSAQAPAGQPPAGQTPAAPPAGPNPRQPGKVYISGENPGITLREKPGGPALANVSFWRIHWSPVGTGHVCYVTTGDGKSPGDLRVALYDNQKLYEYLTQEIMQVANQAYKDRPFTPVGGAKFGRSGDAIAEHREICNAPNYNVELTWRGLGEPFLFNRDPGTPNNPNPFGLVFLNIPSSQAEIKINGKMLPGAVHPAPTGGGGAILAFGETWRRLQ